MQTCKRCKCFKRCKEFRKREVGRVWQFFSCFLDFTPLMIAQTSYRQYLIIKLLFHLFQVRISVKNHIYIISEMTYCEFVDRFLC